MGSIGFSACGSAYRVQPPIPFRKPPARSALPARGLVDAVCFSQTPYVAEPAPAETDRGSEARGRSPSRLRRPVLRRFWHSGSALSFAEDYVVSVAKAS